MKITFNKQQPTLQHLESRSRKTKSATYNPLKDLQRKIDPQPATDIHRPSITAASLASLSLSLATLAPPAHAMGLNDALTGLEDIIASSGPLGPLLFIIAYAGAAVVLIPASALTIAAGFLFGPVLGTGVVSIASTAGASAAFLIGRYIARPAVRKRVESDARFSAIDAAIGKQGARIVLLLRLSPLFPYSLLNYALSLTSIEFGPYVLASWLGMLPGTVAYVALGGAGKAAAESATGSGTGLIQLGIYALGALGTLGATVLISRAASAALKEAQNDKDDQEPLQR